MFKYVPTHASVEDGSTAMLVAENDESIVLINEDGFSWADPLGQWVPIAEYVPSLFNDFGGYYSVMVDGIEIAKWAPNHMWSEFWDTVKDREGWSYRWVNRE